MGDEFPNKVVEALTHIVKCMVDFPDDVKVSWTSSGNSVLFELNVNKDDKGKVIGRSGKTASAMRHLLNNMGHKEKRSVHLEIVE